MSAIATTKESGTAVLSRLGDRGDIPRITEMALEFWPQTGYGIPADVDSIINLAVRCIDQGLMSVLEADGRVVGFLAGLMAPCIANESVVMGSEIAFWVDPEHRGAGKELLIFAEQAAKAAGVDVWGMMSLETVNPGKVDTLYKSLGYAVGEHSYYKRLSWPQ